MEAEGETDAPQGWRVTVNTEGIDDLQFKMPCGDGSMTILELTQRVAERCQRMVGLGRTVIIEKLVDGDGCILFPEDQVYAVLDNKSTVKVGGGMHECSERNSAPDSCPVGPDARLRRADAAAQRPRQIGWRQPAELVTPDTRVGGTTLRRS